MIHKEIIINAGPEKIWPFITEPEKILKWCFTLESFEYTSGQKRGKNSTFRYIDKGSVHKIEVNFVITEWIENKVFSFKMTSGAHFKGYEGTWSIENGREKSIFRVNEKTTQPYGIIGKLVGIISERRASAVMEEMLERLKYNVEKSV
jgi:uncharacterized protein YndB with AHSA1/START domain